MKKIISLLCICIALITVCSCSLIPEQSNSNNVDMENSMSPEKDSSSDDSSSPEDSSSEEDSSSALKKYVITYETGLKTGVSITAKTQEVCYGEEVILYIPEHTDYIFVKWIIKGTNVEMKNGEFSYEEDITLEAVWKEDGKGDYGFL